MSTVGCELVMDQQQKPEDQSSSPILQRGRLPLPSTTHILRSSTIVTPAVSAPKILQARSSNDPACNRLPSHALQASSAAFLSWEVCMQVLSA